MSRQPPRRGRLVLRDDAVLSLPPVESPHTVRLRRSRRAHTAPIRLFFDRTSAITSVVDCFDDDQPHPVRWDGFISWDDRQVVVDSQSLPESNVRRIWRPTNQFKDMVAHIRRFAGLGVSRWGWRGVRYLGIPLRESGLRKAFINQQARTNRASVG